MCPDCRGNAESGGTCADVEPSLLADRVAISVLCLPTRAPEPHASRDPRNRRRSVEVALRHQEVRLDPQDPAGDLGCPGTGTGADTVELRAAAVEILRNHRPSSEGAAPGPLLGPATTAGLLAHGRVLDQGRSL